MLFQPIRPRIPYYRPFSGASYLGRILSTQSANLLGCWPLAETSGTTADNAEGTAARDGTYANGVTLNADTFLDGTPAPSFDGIDDYVSIFSTDLSNAYNKDEMTLLAWAKIPLAATWTDATNRGIAKIGNGGTNFIQARRTSTNNQLSGNYATSANNQRNFSLAGTTDWFPIVVTASASAGEVKVYSTGGQQGATITPITGTWPAVGLTLGICVIGAATSTTQFFKGLIKYVTFWSVALSAAEVAALATI